MLNFDFEDEANYRKISLFLNILTVVIAASILFIEIYRQGNLFVQSSFLQEKMIPLDVCYFGFKGLAEKKPNKELFDEVVYQGIVDAKMNPLDLSEVHEVGKARPIQNNQLACRISLKDEIGTRSFEIELKEKESAFGYVIKNVTEVAKLVDE